MYVPCEKICITYERFNCQYKRTNKHWSHGIKESAWDEAMNIKTNSWYAVPIIRA